MKPIFFQYKTISISWFMLFSLVLGTISYYMAKIIGVEYGEDKRKIEDIFLTVLISSFAGSRFFYVLRNFNLFKDHPLSIIKLSHYNLSLLGGILTGILILYIISKKEKVQIDKYFDIFLTPFYFTMAVGIWLIPFDRLLRVPLSMRNNPTMILFKSLLFLGAMILQLILSKKRKNKYLSSIILLIVMFLYYII